MEVVIVVASYIFNYPRGKETETDSTPTQWFTPPRACKSWDRAGVEGSRQEHNPDLPGRDPTT